MTTTQPDEKLIQFLNDVAKEGMQQLSFTAYQLLAEYGVELDPSFPIDNEWQLRNWTNIPDGWRIYVNEDDSFPKEAHMVGTMAAVFCKPGDDQ